MDAEKDGAPDVVRLERVKYVLEGAMPSRSDPERLHQPRIILQSSLLCTCAANQMRGTFCVHLKELLSSLDEDELREWIVDSQRED